MKWFAAKLVVQVVVADDEIGPWTVDEQVRLIRASDAEEAFQKAVEIGRTQETSYQNSDNQEVRWVFRGLSDLDQLDNEEIKDGVEIICNLTRLSDLSELIREKRDLTIFGWERNKHRTADQILNEGYI